VAEIMLQQTRVETVIPYYQRWMSRFPTLAALAESDLQDVLACWEGLGYYARARSLHRAAGIILHKHGGIFPSDFKTVLSLPGIGHSSAADILSIAFGQDHAALDGNIKRVIARLSDLPDELNSPAFLEKCRATLAGLLPAGRAGDFNQALMDLGATVCLPAAPTCAACPLVQNCLANQHQTQSVRPVSRAKPAIPQYFVTAGVILRGEPGTRQVLLAQRPQHGLLGGMWEYPGGKQEPAESLADCLKRELREELGVEVEVGAEIGTFKHAYTHFRVTLRANYCRILSGEPAPLAADEVRWVNLADLPAYPMGKLDRLISGVLTQPSG
jgi:A/G-specific adenine glycosylase